MKIKKLHSENTWDLYKRNSLSYALPIRIKKSLWKPNSKAENSKKHVKNPKKRLKCFIYDKRLLKNYNNCHDNENQKVT